MQPTLMQFTCFQSLVFETEMSILSKYSISKPHLRSETKTIPPENGTMEAMMGKENKEGELPFLTSGHGRLLIPVISPHEQRHVRGRPVICERLAVGR
ncbi:hypothetical protein AVEN_218128-1 [Araneus ventricosus]|uniref:Uncharacterized protein n=1 Tax=Araneus ventricosus TaxID=182803 RepID=A0A4Y2I401_ARAVE|nr:hypothetical protein AVEN_218128-1 [Araneus ventricosus]